MKWNIIIVLSVLATSFINTSEGFYIQPKAVQFSAPPISQSLLVNSSLHLSCGLLLSSDWLPSPVIHWHHDGEKMDSEDTELFISSAQFIDAGEYYCSVVDGNSTSPGQPALPTITISWKAHVNVIGISTPPFQNHSVTSCSSLLMRCLDGNAPPPSVNMTLVWTRNGEIISTENSTVYHMTGRGDLHIRGSSTLGEISGVYRCLAASVMVSIAEHSITEDEEQNERGTPTISISLQSSATLLLSGSPLHLLCLLESACDYSTVQWTKDGQTLQYPLDDGVVISNDVMEIISTTPHHSGNYCCQLTGAINCQYITVIGSQVVNTSTDILNTSLPTTLTCTSSNLSVEWYRNGHKMSAGIDGTSLTVPSTGDSSVLGVYQCYLVNITGPPVAQYRILPYGLPNPPHSLTHTSLPINQIPGLNISFQWQPPLHTAGLDQSALQYRITISGPTSHSAIVNTIEYHHVLSSSFSSNYTWNVEILDSMVMVISQSSVKAHVSGSHLLNYPPKAPLLSLSCVNQIPVLNWTEVMYGSYKPQELCVHQTCHGDTTDATTTDEQCTTFLANAIDDTGSVMGSVAMGVATRCTFTAWQITAAAPGFQPANTVTGTLTTTHTDCGQYTTTVSQYATTSSSVSVQMTSLPPEEDGNTVSSTVSTGTTIFPTSFSSMISSLSVSVVASTSSIRHISSFAVSDTPAIITSSPTADTSPSTTTMVPITSPTSSLDTIQLIIVSVTVSIVFLLVLVLFAALFITVLLRTRRRSKGEDISHFIDEVPKIPSFISEDTQSIKTVYDSPSPFKRSNTKLSDSSLPHIQAVLTDDREVETLEEDNRVFETGEITRLQADVTGNERLTVVNFSRPPSENSSYRASKDSDTSSSTLYSEDSNTGYLRYGSSSGYNSDYHVYHISAYPQIHEEDTQYPTDQSTFEQPKILKDFVSSSELIWNSANEETVEDQRHGTLEEDGVSQRSSREWTLSPFLSSFSSNVSTLTETTV